MTVRLAASSVVPIGSNVKSPMIVTSLAGAVEIGGTRLYVIGFAMAGGGAARCAATSAPTAAIRPSFLLEPCLEAVFHTDAYGYRPGRSAIDAVRQARQRCWRHDWVLDIDVKAYFDSIDWERLLKAVRHHTDCPWVLLYIERWLKAPVQMEDGSVVPRTAGTPQGGVITPRTQKVTFIAHRQFAV